MSEQDQNRPVANGYTAGKNKKHKLKNEKPTTKSNTRPEFSRLYPPYTKIWDTIPIVTNALREANHLEELAAEQREDGA